MIAVLALICLAMALIPFGLALINLVLYRPLPQAQSGLPMTMSVLIPARNEEARITPVLEAMLRNDGAGPEIIIGDDGSTDATADIVKQFARRDKRIRLIAIDRNDDEGWAGKNLACYQLAKAARHDLLVFVDADVILADDGLERLAGYFAARPETALLSGFPRQIMGTFWEAMLIPLIHFLLLGFLPFIGVRFTRHPMFGTACGQLVAVRREAYFAVDGHRAFKSLLHDGLHLPRNLRVAGYKTDLADFTDLAATRMYENTPDLRAGLKKNAHEAMATPVGLPVWSAILVLGQVLPIILVLVLWLVDPAGGALTYALIATVLGFALRGLMALVFRQPALGVLLHPFGVAALLQLQWSALLNRRRGGKVIWKGRQY
ncbi:MAG: glycosyltransferase family 2 protein [Rhizobiales bacterium]|nr:glycosyltransferase family 2 protein [Hyphomicrobiales bacterium]